MAARGASGKRAASGKSKISGGGKLDAVLARVAARIGRGSVVSVGFIDGATYPPDDRAERWRNLRQQKATAAAANRQMLAGRGAVNTKGPAQKSQVQIAPLSIAQVAFWQNFGTSRAPARPFFSNTVGAGQKTWAKKLARLLKLNNYDANKALALMGEGIKDEIVKAIADWPADNAPLTVQLKGFNKGLIDKGVMQRHVDWMVRG